VANFKNWGYITQKGQFSFYSSVPVYILRARWHRPNIGPLFQWRPQNLVRRPNTGTGCRYTYELYAWEKQKIHWYPFTCQHGLTALKTQIFVIHCHNLQSHEQKGIFNSVHRRLQFHWYQPSVSPYAGKHTAYPKCHLFPCQTHHSIFSKYIIWNCDYFILLVQYLNFSSYSLHQHLILITQQCFWSVFRECLVQTLVGTLTILTKSFQVYAQVLANKCQDSTSN